MLGTDLARLYLVEVKALNQAVKRNSGRFPADFLFRLSLRETGSSRSQFVTLKHDRELSRRLDLLEAKFGLRPRIGWSTYLYPARNTPLQHLHFLNSNAGRGGVQWSRGSNAKETDPSAAFAHDGWEHERDRYRDQHRIERFHEERPRHIAYAPPVPVYAQPGITITLPW